MLTNLSDVSSVVRFKLPKQDIKVIVIQHNEKDILINSVVDTLMIEPDLGHFTMLSRAIIPLRKNMFDIKEIIIGDVSREWHHKQRVPNKRYYANLADFAK